MRRFSVRSLMALVLVSAVGLAALRNANAFWAGLTLGLALFAVASAVVGALILRGRRRYHWAGFAVFAGGYLAVAVGPWLAEFKPKLGTTQVLSYVQSKVAESAAQFSVAPRQQQRRALLMQKIQAARAVAADPADPALTALNARLATLDANIAKAQVTIESSSRWRSLLPGAVNQEDFLCVGHSVFALLAGLIGTAVAGAFDAWRAREHGDVNDSPRPWQMDE
jgi:hypothetical protein